MAGPTILSTMSTDQTPPPPEKELLLDELDEKSGLLVSGIGALL
jgi:hypothetical protein